MQVRQVAVSDCWVCAYKQSSHTLCVDCMWHIHTVMFMSSIEHDSFYHFNNKHNPPYWFASQSSSQRYWRFFAALIHFIDSVTHLFFIDLCTDSSQVNSTKIKSCWIDNKLMEHINLLQQMVSCLYLTPWQRGHTPSTRKKSAPFPQGSPTGVSWHILRVPSRASPKWPVSHVHGQVPSKRAFALWVVKRREQNVRGSTVTAIRSMY